MTDLKRLREWHEGKADSQFGHSPMTTDDDWMMHAETARILSLLLRVREGCTIEHINEFSELTGLEIYSETCPERTLRDLDELLGGGK